METLIKRRHGGPSSSNVCLHCALCRESCLSSEVNYVRLDAGNDREGEAKEEGERSENMEREEEVLVNTDHASKILAVTRLLLKIQKNEPLAKALVFSSVRHLSFSFFPHSSALSFPSYIPSPLY